MYAAGQGVAPTPPYFQLRVGGTCYLYGSPVSIYTVSTVSLSSGSSTLPRVPTEAVSPVNPYNASVPYLRLTPHLDLALSAPMECLCVLTCFTSLLC